MEQSTKLEQVLEKAYEQMKIRYKDILDISYKLREKKFDMKELVYVLDLRAQIIDQINYIQETIRPVLEVFKDKANIELNMIYENNSKIRNYKDSMKEIIASIQTIDAEISDYIKFLQQDLKDEIKKVNITRKVNNTYKNSSTSITSGRLINSKK